MKTATMTGWRSTRKTLEYEAKVSPEVCILVLPFLTSLINRWLIVRLETTPTVRRPAVKKRSSLRLSFGPGSTSMTEDGAPSEVFTPKKSNLSRQAIEKNALRKSLASSDRPPIRQVDDTRPTYSADYINELKSSTPSTPKDLGEDPTAARALDIASKFGTSLALHNYQQENPLIPTAAEIAEKKDRRARLAKEQEFISLNPSGSDENASNPSDHDNLSDHDPTVSVHHHARPKKKTKYPSSRLVPDDEDIAEGFDSFVQDGRIALSKKSQREQRSHQKDEIRALINEAEGSDSAASSETDGSEAERRAEYEATQTRKAMDGLQHTSSTHDDRPRTPPKITPLPNLASCVLRLRARFKGLEQAQGQRRKEMEAVEKERQDILVRENEIQRLLAEAGKRYEQLRGEMEGASGSNGASNDGIITGGEGAGSMGANVSGHLSNVSGSDSDNGGVQVQAHNPEPNETARQDEDDDDEDEDKRPAFGLGMPGGGGGGGGGGMRPGLGWS